MLTKRHRGLARIELLLALAAVALLFQLFPPLWPTLRGAVDVRNWPRTVWISLNVGVMLALFGIRYGPSLYDEWQAHRARQRIERDKQVMQRKVNEQREVIERLREARKRQVV